MIRTKWFNGEADLSDAYEIRRKVFIEEQNVPEEIEIDGTDKDAWHLVVYDDFLPVATGRIILIDGDYTLGRIAVLKEFRGQKYGDFVVRLLIRQAFEMGAARQVVHAQIQALGFYQKLGFAQYGDEFLEAGILHVSMAHEGDITGGC